VKKKTPNNYQHSATARLKFTKIKFIDLFIYSAKEKKKVSCLFNFILKLGEGEENILRVKKGIQKKKEKKKSEIKTLRKRKERATKIVSN
jgi:hypothetical protein